MEGMCQEIGMWQEIAECEQEKILKLMLECKEKLTEKNCEWNVLNCKEKKRIEKEGKNYRLQLQLGFKLGNSTVANLRKMSEPYSLTKGLTEGPSQLLPAKLYTEDTILIV
jgi:hypothetical protein